MHRDADRTGSEPRRLLILDPRVFGRAEPATVRRFVDRLATVRRETTFAVLGDGIPDGIVLPQPDYFIADGGVRIVREPGGDELTDWPVEAGETSEGGAARHLAEALMISPSDTVFILGPGRGQPERRAREQASPASVITVPLDDPEQVNRALESVRLFLRPARRVSGLCDEAFERAVDSMRRNITDMGFTAASVADNRLGDHDANYAAVWARDGIMSGLWTLCLDDPEMNTCFRRTLETLAEHQSPSGQIPANVRINNASAEYAGLGGIASIDAVLWFVIGVCRYSFACHDRELATNLLPNVERAMAWLAAHDSNNDGLLEIPEASDWMDLFPRSYNVLYDEVLWYIACIDHGTLLAAMGKDGEGWLSHAEAIRHRILEVFWPSGKHLLEMAGGTGGHFSPGEGHYLLSHVTPFDYSWRCDVGGNLMAAMTDLLDDEKSERLFTFLWGVGVNSPYPVACLYPAVHSGAKDWKDYFIVNFLNLPEHYHNGGIWPFLGGLWVRFLGHLGRQELAFQELGQLAEACRAGIHGEWEFNEWLHGRTGRPMGKVHQAWSAASYIKAYKSLTEEGVPKTFQRLDPEAFGGAGPEL